MNKIQIIQFLAVILQMNPEIVGQQLKHDVGPTWRTDIVSLFQLIHGRQNSGSR